jgi:hypothetical protein
LEKLPESFYAPKLVSLLLGGNRIVSLSTSFFSNFPKLRVLDLSRGQFGPFWVTQGTWGRVMDTQLLLKVKNYVEHNYDGQLMKRSGMPLFVV